MTGRPINVRWFKHQGPGSVTFSRVDDTLHVETWRTAGAGGKAETQADVRRARRVRAARAGVQYDSRVRVPVLLD